jgi:hypothetical protein
MLNCRTTSTSSSATKAHCSAWTTNPLRRHRTSEPQKTVRRPPHGFFFGYTTGLDQAAHERRRRRTRKTATAQSDVAHGAGKSQNISDIFTNSIEIYRNSIEISENISDILSLVGRINDFDANSGWG